MEVFVDIDKEGIEIAIQAIKNSFYWAGTKEGNLYWEEVILKLNRIKREGQ